MKGKGLLKRVFSVVMALVLVVGLITVSEPTSAQAEDSEWQLVPSDHTPASGVELPKNVSAIKKIAYTATSEQWTSSAETKPGYSSTATIEDGMALIGDGTLTTQLQSSAVKDTVYITSFYVWTVGTDTVFDMHFDDVGSPSGTGGNYAYNVLKEWSTTHGSYIKSCTIDGETTTGSLTGETGGWKKVEIEWTAKEDGNVLIILGDYGSQSTVTGTIYIDDFVTYVKPTVLYTDYGFYPLGGSAVIALNNVSSAIQALDGKAYVGTMLIDGVETSVTLTESENNLIVSGFTQDTVSKGTIITFEKGARFVSSDGTTVIVFNHALSQTRTGNTGEYGTGYWQTTPASVTTEVSRFVSSSGLIAYTFANTEVSSLSYTTYTGNLKINGIETNVYWLVSGGNFVIRQLDENDNLNQSVFTDDTTLQVDAGTVLTNAASGETVIITNTIKHKYTVSSNSWTEVAWDHTPSTGVKVPANVTTYKKISFSETEYQHSNSVGTSASDGVLVIPGEGTYSTQLLYSDQLSTLETYVTSFYICIKDNGAVFDVHFDDAGSPSGTGGNYAYNVLAEWSTTHKAYISSCTIDGVKATGSIAGATNGWKKVVIEWTPKATGNVLIQLGDYGGQSNVTGTIYIDDFVTHKKPSTIMYTDYGFYPLSSLTLALNNISSSEVKALNDVSYMGTMFIDGMETEIQIKESDDNMVITSGCTQDSGKNLFFKRGTYFISTDGTKAVVLNHDLSYTKTGDGYGSAAWTKNAIAFTTDIALYKITDSLTAYTYTADLLDSFPNGSTFTGNITVNGEAESVTWTLSDACLIPAGVKDDGTTTEIEVKPGTVLTGTYGTITIENGLKYTKNEDTSVSVSTPIGWYKVNDAGQILFNEIDTTALSAYVGDTYTGAILLNGTSYDVTWRVDSTLLVVTNNIADYGDITSIEVENGTILTNTDESGDTITLTNSVDYVKIDGTWYQDTDRTEVTLSYTFEKVNTTTNQILYKIDEETDLDDSGTTNSARGWKTVTVQIGGVDTSVQMFFADNYCTFGNQSASEDAVVEAVKDGTFITIPSTLTLVTDTHIITLNFKDVQNIEKLGQGWGMYTGIYQYPNGNTRYYNIDNGSAYTLTSSNNAIVVEEEDYDGLTTGGTISDVGTYTVKRIENNTLYQEEVVLYKHGDVDENNDIDVCDLVAMKWAQAGTSEEQAARQAGTYAADVDRSGDVGDIDLLALRQALVSDDASAKLSVSKGNSLFNGEMPITGFSTPTDEQYITEEFYQQIAEAGINTIAYSGNAYYDALVAKHLSLAEMNGLKMYVTDSLLTSQTTDTFATRVGNYSMYQSFAGLHIVDEPSYGDVYVNSYDRPIEDYTTAIDLCNKSANISGYVNLFPYYSDTDGATTTNYKEYLTGTFTNTDAEMLSYDHYAIRAGETGWLESWLSGTDFKKTVKAADFYTNLEMVRTQVEGTGKPFWAFAQAGYPITASGTVSDDIKVTAAELQWEINAALAMGAKGVQYYQMFQSSSYAGDDNDYGRSGLFGANGQKNETYYDAAKSQNAFIKVIDEVLMNATNEGVIVADSTAAAALSEEVKLDSYHELTGVSGTNAMVGCFDYYGKTVLYAVNCSTTTGQYVTLELGEVCDVYVTKMEATAVNRTTTTSVSEESDGYEATFWLEPGQAALVIIE